MKENRQILIKSLPLGKLEASNFCLELATMPVLGDDQVLVKTTAFSISAGARAGLQGSASYAGAPAAGRVMNGSGIGQVANRCLSIGICGCHGLGQGPGSPIERLRVVLIDLDGVGARLHTLLVVLLDRGAELRLLRRGAA